jgi:hypothetical protein
MMLKNYVPNYFRSSGSSDVHRADHARGMVKDFWNSDLQNYPSSTHCQESATNLLTGQASRYLV